MAMADIHGDEMTPSASPAAVRQRRRRERRKHGVIIVNLEVNSRAVALLVVAGFLPRDKRSDPTAVRNAFGRFVMKSMTQTAEVTRDNEYF